MKAKTEKEPSERVHQVSFPATTSGSHPSIATRPFLKPSLKSSWSSYWNNKQNSVDADHIRRRSASLPRSWGITPDPTLQVNKRSHSLPSTPPARRTRARSIHFSDGGSQEASMRQLVNEGLKDSTRNSYSGSDSSYALTSFRRPKPGDDSNPPTISQAGLGEQNPAATLRISTMGPVVASQRHSLSSTSSNGNIPRRPALIHKGSNATSFGKPFKDSRGSSSSSTSSSWGSDSHVYRLATTSTTSSATTTFVLEPRFDATVYYALALAGPAYYHTQLILGGGASSSTSYARPIGRCQVLKPTPVKIQPYSQNLGGISPRPDFLARTSSSSNSTSSSSSGSAYPSSSSSGDSRSSLLSSASSLHRPLKPRRRRLSDGRHPHEHHSFQTHGKVFDQAAYYALALAGPVYYHSQRGAASGAGSKTDGAKLLSEYRSRGKAWASWVVGVA